MDENDHKKLGPQLGLFYIDPEIGKGLPMFLPKGTAMKRELEQFVIKEETKRGYQHVATPDIARLDIYKKSGHYSHYKDSMYAPIVIDDEEFMLRPMSCPHHFHLFLSEPRSYRELPMRIAELAQLYRYEQSGELMGLQRVRTFCLTDAHIMCQDEKQAVDEIGKALDLIEHMAGTFGLELDKQYRYRLSLGDKDDSKKYFKDDKAWAKSEDLMRQLMKERGSKFEEAVGEAAFYGPKIDVQMKNVNGKEDTVFTVQYDFCMPVQFNMTYIATDGTQKPVFVVHRSSIGAIERFMAFLIEHYKGAFPLWLSPVQVKILPIADAHKGYANEILETLREADIRTELDDSNETLGKKIRNAKLEKVPYFLVLGDAEAKDKIIKLEKREGGSEILSLASLLEKLQTEIRGKNNTIPYRAFLRILSPV